MCIRDRAYPGLLAERYGIPEDRSPHELLEQIAIARSCLLKGGGLAALGTS